MVAKPSFRVRKMRWGGRSGARREVTSCGNGITESGAGHGGIRGDSLILILADLVGLRVGSSGRYWKRRAKREVKYDKATQV